jgi:hypothetical protein
MPTVKELLKSGRKDELWQMCCGFLDLNVEQFMSIQKRLLLEQIELLNNSAIGKKIFKGTMPQNIEEFRRRAPLTKYKDYCPELSEKRDDALPVKPLYWQHTSGRSIDYPFKWESIKWMPITPGASRELGILAAAYTLFSTCQKKYDTSGLKRGLKFVYAVAPRPYTSGTLAYIATEALEATSLPPLEMAEKMSFEDRISSSIKLAANKGLDFYFGITVAMVAIGERISQQVGNVNIFSMLSQPRAILRFARGMIKAKMAGRKLLPKDIWSIRGAICTGTDAEIFGQLIKDTWGKYPLNMFGSTEAGYIASQTWDFGTMTFNPSMNFLEFIPESEYEKCQQDNSYIPACLTLDEVKVGEKYELVISNFHGGPLIRYHTGDAIQIMALSNNKLGINLPQMEFVGRVDDRLDIGGFIRLTEKVIWQAISNINIPYVDWAARKENEKGVPILHVFLELRSAKHSDPSTIAKAIYVELKKMDDGFMYGNIEDVLNTMPIKVTLLPQGAFTNYINFRRSQGADLAHLKPRHINPSDKEIEMLRMTAAEEGKQEPIKVGVPAGS